MKRYQNPDIFEHLAMSYALGTLQGKARIRFEKLMRKHLYLRAVTNAYQQQFAPLANLIPSETPPARVWNAISKELQLGKAAAPRKSWFASVWSHVPVAAFAAVVASVGTVLLLNLNNQPDIYMANMKTPVQQDKMMVVMVYHETMEIAFDMPSGALPVKDDMMPTVWCIPKDSNKPPMRMGTLTAQGENRMPIDKATWKEMANVSQFAISLEPMDKPPSDTPQGKVIFSGELAAL
ncbi:Anti-sigma-K factor RskA [Thiothrix caldifontis]|jgi:Anti-sigma-K factor rskA.|uniref:Anti-sigma-K factor RskA n=1 Tax=Thiothrix caldifontis TaxID=525918 RepID=A0A1H4ESE9_9GAMM|nr:anti-sigma factor [Thiothrix caldifontis]SEA87192.1 Anti-sigma-K factor RskA [Thiothrix caldifontis]